MNVIHRVVRHARIMRKNHGELQSPPFLVLFINSICNMKCEHCFYWTHLNKRDDLSRDEIFALSRSLGPIENLNLSGGEPFLRKEFSEICRQFIAHNGVRQIYVPTNGWYTDKIVKAIREVLEAEGQGPGGGRRGGGFHAVSLERFVRVSSWGKSVRTCAPRARARRRSPRSQTASSPDRPRSARTPRSGAAGRSRARDVSGA